MSNYTYHGTSDLIAMPGRSVQTYPSGLMRVERLFLCRKSDASKHRKILQVNNFMPNDNNAPAIDGLLIFPEPQERDRDDGFIEFKVSAYARWKDEDYISKGAALIFIDGAQIVGVKNQGLGANYTIKRVLPAYAGMTNVINPPESISPEVSITLEDRFIGSEFEEKIKSDFKKFSKLSLELTQFSETNFGAWSEFTYTYQTKAFVSLPASF
jgi:hypothetical protein